MVEEVGMIFLVKEFCSLYNLVFVSTVRELWYIRIECLSGGVGVFIVWLRV